MAFRDQESSPIRFIVSLYSGLPTNIGGLIGAFDWNGDQYMEVVRSDDAGAGALGEHGGCMLRLRMQ